MRCGHTFPNPNNAEGPPEAMISKGRDRLPFHFAWIDGSMVVLGDSPGLPRGTEVMAIGGVAPSAILRQLLSLGSVDGHNETKRVRLMEVRGEERWELFDVYFPPGPTGARGRGRGATEGEDACRARARARGAAHRPFHPSYSAQARRRHQGLRRPAWSLERLPGGVGWITMRSWALYDSQWDWRTALNADLDALTDEKARALVIDLRGNGGGLDCGDVVLERVAERDVAKPAGARFTATAARPTT